MNKIFFLLILSLFNNWQITAKAASLTVTDSEETSLLPRCQFSPMNIVQSKEWDIVNSNVKLLQTHGINLIDKIPGFDRFLATHEQNFRSREELELLKFQGKDFEVSEKLISQASLLMNDKKFPDKILRVKLIFGNLLASEQICGEGASILATTFMMPEKYQMIFKGFPLQPSSILSNYFVQKYEQMSSFRISKMKPIRIAAGKDTEQDRLSWLYHESHLAETLRLETESYSFVRIFVQNS